MTGGESDGIVGNGRIVLAARKIVDLMIGGAEERSRRRIVRTGWLSVRL